VKTPNFRSTEPAASWNATRRPDPLTAGQKLLLRVTTPPVPSTPGRPRGSPPRGSTRIAPPCLPSPNVPDSKASRSTTALAGWIIFRRRGITRRLFKESGRTPLPPPLSSFVSPSFFSRFTPASFSVPCRDPILSPASLCLPHLALSLPAVPSSRLRAASASPRDSRDSLANNILLSPKAESGPRKASFLIR